MSGHSINTYSDYGYQYGYQYGYHHIHSPTSTFPSGSISVSQQTLQHRDPHPKLPPQEAPKISGEIWILFQMIRIQIQQPGFWSHFK